MSPAARERAIFLTVSAAMLPLVIGEAFLMKAIFGDGPMASDWAVAAFVLLIVLVVFGNFLVWWLGIGWLCRKLAP